MKITIKIYREESIAKCCPNIEYSWEIMNVLPENARQFAVLKHAEGKQIPSVPSECAFLLRKNACPFIVQTGTDPQRKQKQSA